MSYKSFEPFNKVLGDLAPTARSNLIFRLINLASQLSGVVEDLPGNWARAYASIQQLQYDADGKLEDVTSAEAISSVDNLIYSVRSKFLSLKNDLDSLAKQIEDTPVNIILQQVDSRFNITDALVPGKYYFYYWQSPVTRLNAYVQFDVDISGHFSNILTGTLNASDPVPAGQYITLTNAGTFGMALRISRLKNSQKSTIMLAALTSEGVLNVCNMLSNGTFIQSDGTSSFSEYTGPAAITGSALNVTNQSRDITVPVTLKANEILSYNDGSSMLVELNRLVGLE